jgi:dipicolinate synthase subunit A
MEESRMQRLWFDESDERVRILRELWKNRAVTAENGAPVYIFAPNKLLTVSDVSELDGGACIFAGFADRDAAELLRTRGSRLKLFSEDECFISENAWLTAEGALSVLIAKTKRSLAELCILIVGFGRVGRAMARTLRNNHADITVATTSKAAEAAHIAKTVVTGEWDLKRYDTVINTVPVRLFSEKDYDALSSGRLYMELASPPYGIDMVAAAAAGVAVAAEPAIPARFAPESAARLMERSMTAVLEIT